MQVLQGKRAKILHTVINSTEPTANGSKGWDIFLENHMKGSCLGSLHNNSYDLSLSFRCLVGWDAHSPSTLGTETVTEHYAQKNLWCSGGQVTGKGKAEM